MILLFFCPVNEQYKICASILFIGMNPLDGNILPSILCQGCREFLALRQAWEVERLLTFLAKHSFPLSRRAGGGIEGTSLPGMSFSPSALWSAFHKSNNSPQSSTGDRDDHQPYFNDLSVAPHIRYTSSFNSRIKNFLDLLVPKMNLSSLSISKTVQ